MERRVVGSTKKRLVRPRCLVHSLADITLLSRDGKEFPCHKCILMARSEYFRVMFDSTWLEPVPFLFHSERYRRLQSLERCSKDALEGLAACYRSKLLSASSGSSTDPAKASDDARPTSSVDEASGKATSDGKELYEESKDGIREDKYASELLFEEGVIWEEGATPLSERAEAGGYGERDSPWPIQQLDASSIPCGMPEIVEESSSESDFGPYYHGSDYMGYFVSQTIFLISGENRMEAHLHNC
ncbi:unnamed protein product [Darwinula stevensoni]|uniref:BTB domain-containing protein n=1 Tax=Darwinula stevensoni TaxID=69355 RepID=A0A7R8XB83_9CRUS|nr:unnamed protein product [Darwinula stevensoni]CAG0892593.1 unnamed protein product [Darwinula stevensoni]